MHKKFLLLTALIVTSPVISMAETTPENDLSSGMQSLYNSAQKLSIGNSVLAVRINEANMKLNALQLRYKQLSFENDQLSNEALRLQDNNPADAREITALEKESFDATAKIEELKDKMKLEADMIANIPAQEARFDERMAELNVPKELPTPVDPNAKEKLQLLKQIDASKARQQELYVKLSAGQTATPQVRVESAAVKENLMASIQQVQTEIDQIKVMSAPKTIVPVDNAQLAELQVNVATLKKNHDELEDLLVRMQQKSQSMQNNIEQKAEYNRLNDNLDKINMEAKQLKAEVRDLRIQMVELDKRKTYLDMTLRK